jgi:hypothetical protein
MACGNFILTFKHYWTDLANFLQIFAHTRSNSAVFIIKFVKSCKHSLSLKDLLTFCSFKLNIRSLHSYLDLYSYKMTFKALWSAYNTLFHTSLYHKNLTTQIKLTVKKNIIVVFETTLRNIDIIQVRPQHSSKEQFEQRINSVRNIYIWSSDSSLVFLLYVLLRWRQWTFISKKIVL